MTWSSVSTGLGWAVDQDGNLIDLVDDRSFGERSQAQLDGTKRPSAQLPTAF